MKNIHEAASELCESVEGIPALDVRLIAIHIPSADGGYWRVTLEKEEPRATRKDILQDEEGRYRLR